MVWFNLCSLPNWVVGKGLVVIFINCQVMSTINQLDYENQNLFIYLILV